MLASQQIFSETIRPIEYMFHLNTSYGAGKRKFVQMVQVTWPRWQPCPYMVKKLFKIVFSVTRRSITLVPGTYMYIRNVRPTKFVQS